MEFNICSSPIYNTNGAKLPFKKTKKQNSNISEDFQIFRMSLYIKTSGDFKMLDSKQQQQQKNTQGLFISLKIEHLLSFTW